MSVSEIPFLGAFATARGVTFRLLTTRAQGARVRFFDAAGGAISTVAMVACGGGVFEAHVAAAGPGTLYKFVLDGTELPDPYARFLPRGVHGPAEVAAPGYAWRSGAGVFRPLSEHVVYELHVGTFTREGTYEGIRRRLAYLVDLGITAIELMPLSAFAGERGWGYDGVAHYAPFAGYGTPDQLRALVDDAHALGLSMFLDVVYNHFGPSGNYLSAYCQEYFTTEIQTAWGDAPNFGYEPMRRYVVDNARYWLEQFRFDGLRLDAVHALVDPSPRHVLTELAGGVSRLNPRKLLVAEDERNEPATLTVSGMDAVWADDFHHQVRVTLTGERDGYYRAYAPGVDGVARAINGGWLYEGQEYAPTGKMRGRPSGDLVAEAFVYCIQNHDQVGNRALGDRLSTSISIDAYCAVSMLLLFLPMTPLLFMGQEWASSSPFLYFTDHEADLGDKIRDGRRGEFKDFDAFADPEARSKIPDPQALETFVASQLDWDERVRPGHARVLALYRDLLTLRRTDPVLRHSSRKEIVAEARGPLLIVRRTLGRETRVLLVNFGDEPASLDPLRERGDLRVLCASSGETVRDVLGAWTALMLAPV